MTPSTHLTASVDADDVPDILWKGVLPRLLLLPEWSEEHGQVLRKLALPVWFGAAGVMLQIAPSGADQALVNVDANNGP